MADMSQLSVDEDKRLLMYSALILAVLVLFMYVLNYRPDGVDCHCADEDVRYVVRAVRPNGKPVEKGQGRLKWLLLIVLVALVVLEMVELCM